MMDPLYEETHHGFTIKIHQDESCDNGPRDWDNLGKMVCWWSGYILGDEQPECQPYEYLRQLAAKIVGSDAVEDPDVVSNEHVKAILDKHVVMLELFVYEHSGITMRTGAFSCPWDSGQAGFIYATSEMLAKEYKDHGGDTPENREKAKKGLKGEVETYAEFLGGRVYGYVVEDEYGNHLDSCWGFIGGEDFNPITEEGYVLNEARSVADWHYGEKVCALQSTCNFSD